MKVFKDEEFEFLDKRTKRILLESREDYIPHTPYAYEKKMLGAVQNGNIEQAFYWMNRVDSGKGGRLADNPFRQEQIMFIVFTTLITRAALEGGVKEDLAYAMSDSYIQTVQSCKELAQVLKLKERALKDFVNAVKSQKKSAPYSRAIRKAIQYMRTHIREKLLIKDLAREAGLSSGRFSHLFKEETGMTPIAYFQKEKIEMAKDMLKDSEDKIYEISTILGFPDESYFAKVFRKQVGITPGEYRKII